MAFKNLGFNSLSGLSYCTRMDIKNGAEMLGPISVIGL